MIVVVMGVSGSGKSVVGQALADRPRLAVLRRRRFSSGGQRRQDGGRHAAHGRRPLAVARSAGLRNGGDRRARRARRAGVLGVAAGVPRPDQPGAGTVRFVHLAGDHDTIAARLATRSHRYMPPTLLASQFATLEPPQDAIVVDVRDAVPMQVAKIRAALNFRITLRGRMSDDNCKPTTRAGHLGRTPRRSIWARSTRRSFARRRCSFRRSRSSSRRRAASTRASATACTACRPSPICRTRSRPSRARIAALAVPSGLTATTLPLLALLKAGDHVLVTDAVYGPTRRFCNNHLLRLGVEVSYYDPLLGAGDRARIPAEHARRVHRVAGIADVLRAGHPGDRRRRAPARRARRHRQFVGHAVRLSLVRPRRRRVRARGDQVHRRPFGRALRPDPRERGDVPGAAPAVDGHGRHRVARRLLPRAARLAHAAAAPRAARRERAHDRAVAEDAARSARSDLSRRFPARAATSCGSATSSARRDCSPSCCSRWRRRASTRCSTACACSEWAGAGAASRASSSRSIRSACRPPRRGTRAGRACGLPSGSRIPDDLIADLTAGLARLSA